MANKFKKALALVLASAMVVTVAPAPAASTAEAASKYSITKKTSISPAKTYTYKVKGVSKKQYIKVNAAKGVTVKVGSKTVKKATKTAGTVKVKGTGKAISLKLTAKDSVANYKTKLKVNIFNKNNNKKVKTLSSTSTVKVQALEITSVVPAAQGGDYKYVTAKFNKSVAGLSAADVIITNKGTGKVHSIETVSISSNGKTVNMTLLGDAQAANSTFLEANTDYVLEVTKNNVTAKMDFSIDAVLENLVVTDVDKEKKTITVEAPEIGSGTWTSGTNTEYTLNVPSTTSIDYEEVLGRTATVWYDKNNTITKINLADETVTYGGYLVTKDDKLQQVYLTNAITQEKLYTQDADYVKGSSIYPTVLIDKTTAANKNVEKGFSYNSSVKTNVPDGNSALMYAKVVTNSTGTVRSIVGVDVWNDNLLVDTVSGNTIYNGKESKTLKDYTIIKEGKTIEISGISTGDVVFWNDTGKVAEVMTQNLTGALTAVYTDKFDFYGRTFSYKSALVNAGIAKVPTNTMLRYKDGDEFADVTPDVMNSFKASGKDVTVYFDRSASPIYIAGTEGDAEYTTAQIALTEDGSGYSQANEGYVKLKGYNATTDKVETYDIKVNNLKTVSVGSIETKVGKDSVTAFTTNDETAATTLVKAVGGNAGTVLTISQDFKLFQLVTIKTDKDGVVRGVSIPVANATGYALTAMDGSTKVNFKAGYKTLTANGTGLSVSSSTPVYIIDKDKKTGEDTTYGDLTGQVANANIANVWIYGNADTNTVTAIVIDKVNSEYDGTGDAGSAFKAVVSTYLENADETPASLTVISGTTETTYTKFSSNLSGLGFSTGDIILITPSKDGETILGAEASANVNFGNYAQVDAAKKQFSITNATSTTYTLATNVTPTIVKFNTDDPSNLKVESIGFDELYGTDTTVRVSWLDGATTTADTIVVSPLSAKATAATALQAASDAYDKVVSDEGAETWAKFNAAYMVAGAAVAAYVAEDNINNNAADIKTTGNKTLSDLATTATDRVATNKAAVEAVFTEDKNAYASLDAAITAITNAGKGSITEIKASAASEATTITVDVTYYDFANSTTSSTNKKLTHVTGVSAGGIANGKVLYPETE